MLYRTVANGTPPQGGKGRVTQKRPGRWTASTWRARTEPEAGEAPGHVSVSGVDEASEELGRKLGQWTKLAEAKEDEMLRCVCEWHVDINAPCPPT